MKIIKCDICGKEIKNVVKAWDEKAFTDMDNRPIEDVCDECYKTIYCCINMMKETKWRPDFHEVLKSDKILERDIAGYKLSELEEKTIEILRGVIYGNTFL